MFNVMSRRISDDLMSCSYVLNSDDDQPLVMDLTAGFDSRDRLVVAADLYDYENDVCRSSTAAVVNREDAESLALRYGVTYDRLPEIIAGGMDEWREEVNPGFDYVMDCFKEITERLLDEGCRFQIINGGI